MRLAAAGQTSCMCTCALWKWFLFCWHSPLLSFFFICVRRWIAERHFPLDTNLLRDFLFAELFPTTFRDDAQRPGSPIQTRVFFFNTDTPAGSRPWRPWRPAAIVAHFSAWPSFGAPKNNNTRRSCTWSCEPIITWPLEKTVGNFLYVFLIFKKLNSVKVLKGEKVSWNL